MINVINVRRNLFLVVLAVVFTLGLTFASIELPRLADEVLQRQANFLDVATGSGPDSEYRTELYFQYYHLRLIGYACLAAIVLMIIIGFVTNRSGLSSAGAILLFLPVFGQFALTMFFLGGLGFMRLIWLPFLDVSFDVMRLGEIVHLPYRLLEGLLSRLGLAAETALPLAIVGLGWLVFMLGTLAWFHARIRGRDVADFWIYRVSRHPQYLGWMIWSYGILYIPGPNIRKNFELSNSLPWLLMTMVIIGVALFEEIRMSRRYGDAYVAYRRRVPFLFPVPRFVTRIISLPQRIMFGTDRPERKREVLAVLGVYTVLAVAVSVIYGGLVSLPNPFSTPVDQRIELLAREVGTSPHHGEMRRAAAELAELGEPAVDALVGLLDHEDLYVRWYVAAALGRIPSERVIQPLVDRLHDPERQVRRVAAGALGRPEARAAVPALIAALQDPARDMGAQAARSLGTIGDVKAVPALLAALADAPPVTAGAAAEALGRIGTREAVDPLIRCLENRPDCPCLQVGQALWQLGSERAFDAFAAGLRSGTWWLRSANATALGRTRSEKAVPPLVAALADESANVRRAVVLALMETGSPATLDALRQAMGDDDFEVRMYAREAVRAIEATSDGNN